MSRFAEQRQAALDALRPAPMLESQVVPAPAKAKPAKSKTLAGAIGDPGI